MRRISEIGWEGSAVVFGEEEEREEDVLVGVGAVYFGSGVDLEVGGR